MRRPTSAQDHPQERPQERGISLIELVLAMAIFALVAVLGAQALTGMLRMREDLTARAAQATALSEVTSLLRADLSALVPMLFYPPGGSAPQSALRFDHQGATGLLSLSRAGSAEFDMGQNTVRNGGASRGQAERGADLRPIRVEWRLQQGALNRRVWPSLFPAEVTGLSPPVTWPSPEVRAALGPIQALRLRSYWPQIGWVEGTQSATLPRGNSLGGATAGSPDSDRGARAHEVYSSSLPLAVELTLVTRDHGNISLLESLK